MKRIIFLSAILFIVAQLTFSQSNYKRVSISNITPSLLQQLDREGIDLTYGAVIQDNTLKLELNDGEQVITRKFIKL